MVVSSHIKILSEKRPAVGGDVVYRCGGERVEIIVLTSNDEDFVCTFDVHTRSIFSFLIHVGTSLGSVSVCLQVNFDDAASSTIAVDLKYLIGADWSAIPVTTKHSITRIRTTVLC